MTQRFAASVKKAARVLTLTAAVLAVFVLSCLASVLVHSNAPLVRALAAEQISRLLGAQFQGRVVIASLDHLSADQVRASRIEIQDTQGKALLVAQGVNAHFSLLGFAGEILSTEDPMALAVRHVRIEHVDVIVELDPNTGRTTLEQALSLKPATRLSTGSGRRRQLSLWFPIIELGEVQARVNLKNQSLNVRVSRAQGRVSVEPKGVSVDVDRFATVLSGPAFNGTALDGTTLRSMTGTGAAHLQFPGTHQVEIQGAIGTLDFSGRFRQRGNQMSLQVDVPHADPADITALWPDWPAHQAAEAHWRSTGSWPAFETDLDLTLADGSSLDAEGTVQMAPEPQAQLQIFAKDLNLHSFADAAPQTAFTVNGRVSALAAATGMRLTFSASTDSTTIANQDVPRSEVTGSLDDKGLAVEGQLFEPSAPATFRFEWSPHGAMSLHAQAQSVALGSWRFASDGIAGAASFTLDAKSEHNQLDWQLQTEVNRLRFYEFQVGHAAIQAHGTGSPIGILQT
ncbi:MAG TPA: hypothetical protein VL137_17850, partial [Polyangiaceae bacterium]|nr:hypothetical protein [Polyangiaceae bacterium]